jgi:hypothetical protein
MSSRPAGAVVTSLLLALIGIGAIAFASLLVAVSRSAGGNTAILDAPLVIVGLLLAYGVTSVVAAVGVWQVRPWAWPLGVVIGLTGAVGCAVALVTSGQALMIVGLLLTTAIVAALSGPSVRQAFRV